MTNSSNTLIPGRATAAGTGRFRDRSATHPSHFRSWQGLSLSSVGIGTYLGLDDDETDALYATALLRAWQRGLNVVDTAINYRNQRSERVIGATLSRAIAAGAVARDEVLISTKAGFLTGDGTRPADTHTYLEETYLRPGIVDRTQLVQRSHCLAPRYLADQMERSRRNLGLETVDVFFLHNPEVQLAEVSREELGRRLRAAFELLERAVEEGRIAWYGTATWNGYRRPAGAADGLSLGEVLAAARDVAGAGHHFAAVQLPFNLLMTEAYKLRNQDGERSLLEAARDEGLLVTTSASIVQGRLAALELAYPDSGLETTSQHVLQLVRSTPGVGAALVGMKHARHVDENARVCAVPPLSGEAVAALMELPA